MSVFRKMTDAKDHEFLRARNTAICDALVRVTDVAVPGTILSSETRERYGVMMAEELGAVSKEAVILANPFSLQRDTLFPEEGDIIRDFKLTMAINEIATLENIELPDDDITKCMQEIREEAFVPDIDEIFLRAKAVAVVAQHAVFDWLADRADFEVEYVDAN